MKTYENSAKVNKDRLVISCPHAIKPIVWQMNVSETAMGAFEIDHAYDTHILAFRKPGTKKSETIAAFETHEQAVNMLMQTSSALENAYSNEHTTPINQTSCTAKKSSKCGFFKVLLWIVGGIFILFLLFMISGAMRMNRITNVSGTSSRTATTQSSGAPVESGVPMSADDFLNNR